MFVDSRDDARRFFVEVRRKTQAGERLEPLEAVVAEVIGAHPEYHDLLDDAERALDADFPPERGEMNPFLHMGLHVALQEQLRADRPSGVVELYRRMLQSPASDVHDVEHTFMDCLGEALWEASRRGGVPDERAYLECVRKRLR